MSEDRELGWDEEVSEGEGFTLLPAGKVKFTVTDFERGRSKGEGKLPPCNMAIVNLKLETQDGLIGGCRVYLVLHTSMQWKINEFFTALGFAKSEDGKVRMDWKSIIQRSGFCNIKVRTSDGKEFNEVDKFLIPETTQPQPQTQVQQPSFIPPYQPSQPVQSAPQASAGGWA